MSKLRAAACWAIALLTLSCSPSATTATADVVLLRAAVADWQEGPTDGRVCLDARVLDAPDSGRVVYWATPILTALLADTLIAVDSSTLPSAHPPLRYCVPSLGRPRIACGIPHVHDHVVDIRMNAWAPASGSDTSLHVPSSVTLAWRFHGWRVIAHPDQHFRILHG